MGLNDLVPEEKKTKSRTSRTAPKTNRHGRKIDRGHPEDGFKIGDKEIKLREDMKHISPLDCSYCDEGTAFPVMGLTRHGSLYRCYRIFCENSVMKHKREPVRESELIEVRNKMELRAKRRGL